MHIRELASLTNTPQRQIRFMIAEGFVPPPTGGRARADYGDDHVTAVRRYNALKRQGLPPQAIKVLLAGSMTVPFPVLAGLTLHVDPQLMGRPMDVDAVSDRIRDVLRDIFEEPSDAEPDPPDRP